MTLEERVKQLEEQQTEHRLQISELLKCVAELSVAGRKTAESMNDIGRCTAKLLSAHPEIEPPKSRRKK